MSSTTAIYGWAYPDPGDAGDVPYWMQSLAEAIEATMSKADKRGIPAGCEKRLTASSASTTTNADVAGLSFTTTLEDGRRYRLKFDGMLASTVASDRGTVSLKVDGSAIKTAQSEQFVTASSAYATPVERIIICSSGAGADVAPGSHTFALNIARLSGSGAINIVASAGTPAQFWLEDAGPYRS